MKEFWSLIQKYYLKRKKIFVIQNVYLLVRKNKNSAILINPFSKKPPPPSENRSYFRWFLLEVSKFVWLFRVWPHDQFKNDWEHFYSGKIVMAFGQKLKKAIFWKNTAQNQKSQNSPPQNQPINLPDWQGQGISTILKETMAIFNEIAILVIFVGREKISPRTFFPKPIFLWFLGLDT